MNEQFPESNNPTPEQTPSDQPQSVQPVKSRSSRNWVVITIMTVALVGMIIVARHSAHNGGTRLPGQVAGMPAPDFELKEVGTGKLVRLSDLKGKAVVLDFWATWCPPCKAEIPYLVDLQKQYGPEGLAIVGVTMDDASEQDISKFASDMGINYTLVLGTDKIGDTYGVDSYPTTFYVGRDGKILNRDEGLSSHYDIESNIKAALSQREQPIAEQRGANEAAPAAPTAR